MKASTGISFLLATCLSASVSASWQDMLKKSLESTALPGSTTQAASSAFSSAEMNNALKEALQQGIEMAIDMLGKENGFLKDPSVFIPAPGMMSTIADNLRKMGRGDLVDSFETTINRAAEASVSEGLGIFSDALKAMSLEDAQKILNGPDNAATEYFRKFGEERLQQAMLPIVQDATNQAGVTSAYKNLSKSAGGYLSSFMSTDSLDLDRYVTDQAIDGLFVKIAEEEKRIRENPAARSTDLLKKVFGSL
jgi:hypothetical protein